ncbi:growth factor receptor-bound protein 10-like isoform X2 [Physeter macrocephalus]|uniref:Growth factor receptor-bound protein 10-like isoform X2 n=1 Tax=Physeter macrocephalus TaxID=9755 RepID=A0A9W2WPK8_PHYMC|nr:growth factor receptor-bound protein 10-like isoform X2 [Physeter catodon]
MPDSCGVGHHAEPEEGAAGGDGPVTGRRFSPVSVQPGGHQTPRAPENPRQDQVEQTSPRRPGDLAGPGFPAPPDRLANHQACPLPGLASGRHSPGIIQTCMCFTEFVLVLDLSEPPLLKMTVRPEDDVDLETLVNDMDASLESLCAAAETAPLLHNGRHPRGRPPGARPLQGQVAPRQRLQRSQPMHILAVRRLQQEDQQLRTSSLPAIPNPFPELCGPRSPPALTPGSLPPGPAAAKQVSHPWLERQAARVRS